jgi:hypothetical protein
VLPKRVVTQTRGLGYHSTFQDIPTLGAVAKRLAVSELYWGEKFYAYTFVRKSPIWGLTSGVLDLVALTVELNSRSHARGAVTH